MRVLIVMHTIYISFIIPKVGTSLYKVCDINSDFIKYSLKFLHRHAKTRVAIYNNFI